MIAELENPYILLHEKRLSSLQSCSAGARSGGAEAAAADRREDIEARHSPPWCQQIAAAAQGRGG